MFGSIAKLIVYTIHVENDWPDSGRIPRGFRADSGRKSGYTGRQGGFRANSGWIPPEIRVTQIRPTYLKARGSNMTLGYSWCDRSTATIPR